MEQGVVLDRRAGQRAAPPSRRPRPTTARPLGRGWCAWRARGCARSWVSASGRRARPAGTAACRGTVAAPSARPPSSVQARISARCITRTPDRCRESAPPMCIRHELSPAHEHLGAGVADVPRLVGAHRHRVVGVLHRERAAEAAALLGARQVDQSQAADVAQQPGRPVAHVEHPQRVAGRVVGHPVREVGADVLTPSTSTRNSRELVGPRARSRRPRRARPASPAAPGHDRVLVTHRAGARPRRGDDRVVALEGRDEAAHHRHRLVEVAGVDHRLAAAGLAGREVHVHPEPAQQPHHGLAGVGEQRVVQRR